MPHTDPKDNKIGKLEKENERLKKQLTKFAKDRYGLFWFDVPEGFEDDVENKLPILKEVPKLAIKSKDEKPTHILIEGDNYHALTCLNYTHKGKVDIIYIDPPYNTGSDGFKYKDKRILDKYPDGTEVPADHPLRHSYWLSFMKKRLNLAKNLLNDKGVIFINIDDNELAQLKLLCDEIFSEKNFIALLVIESGEVFGTKAAHIEKTFVKVKDYILVFAKNKSLINNKQPLFDEARELYDSHYNTIIEKAKNSFVKKSLPKFLKDVRWVEKLFNENKLEINSENINRLMKMNDKFREYIFTDLANKLYADAPFNKKIDNSNYKAQTPFIFEDKILFKTSSGSLRMYIPFSDTLRQSDDFTFQFTRTTIRGDLWKNFHFDMRNVQDEGKTDFKNGKKPVRLIRQLLKWFNKPNSIVFDFFAGSGTAGQAVMELNEEDGGRRQFILNTNNDEIVNGEKHKIMSDVCYPRIENVIKGYNNTRGVGNSIKYYKTAFVGKNNILDADDRDKIELAHNAGEMLAIAENTLEEIEKNDYFQLFENNKQYTAIYFREEFDKFDKFEKRIRELKKPVVVYIFSWEKELDFNGFEDDKNVRVKTIPQPILEIYKQIYNLA